MRKTMLATTLASAAFLLNPMMGCEGGWQYGSAEMRAAIEGTYKIEGAGGTPLVVALRARTIDDVVGLGDALDLIAPAAACGNRSMIASAEACIDSSTMPLVVTILEGALQPNTTIKATFEVHAKTFTRGQLTIDIDDATTSHYIDSGNLVLSPSGDALADHWGSLAIEKLAKAEPAKPQRSGK